MLDVNPSFFSEQVGLIIGRGGETIKGLQSKTGARIQVCCSNIQNAFLYTKQLGFLFLYG